MLLTFLLIFVVMLNNGICVWIKEMENAGLFEGDMLLTPSQRKVIHNGTFSYGSTSSKEFQHWPNEKAIPYDITSSIGAEGIKAINEAIAEYHKHTCLKFVKRTNQRAYLSFYKGFGCSSPVGYRGFKNSISLAPGCWKKGVVMHEIAHSLGKHKRWMYCCFTKNTLHCRCKADYLLRYYLKNRKFEEHLQITIFNGSITGFVHEQSRPDRDNFVKIIWNNILPDMRGNFAKEPAKNIDSLGTAYDLCSMMHYSKDAFGSGRITIEVLDKTKQNWIGQRDGFSEIDKRQINMMYKCKNTPVCDNKDNSCEMYSKIGRCTDEKHKKWMVVNCCKACEGKNSSCGCRNNNERCDAWEKLGECWRNKQYMHKNCRKSCKLC